MDKARAPQSGEKHWRFLPVKRPDRFAESRRALQMNPDSVNIARDAIDDFCTR